VWKLALEVTIDQSKYHGKIKFVWFLIFSLFVCVFLPFNSDIRARVLYHQFIYQNFVEADDFALLKVKDIQGIWDWHKSVWVEKVFLNDTFALPPDSSVYLSAIPYVEVLFLPLVLPPYPSHP